MTPPSDYPWMNYGLWMALSEYMGFLRGHIVRLMLADQGRVEAAQEALAATQKLLELLKGKLEGATDGKAL